MSDLVRLMLTYLMKKMVICIFLVVWMSIVASATEPAPPKRIISLAPSTTEILFALGLDDNIVGVTTFCDYPPAAKKKPKIGGMSNPSLESIVALNPDIVVMTTDGNPKEFEELLQGLHINTIVFTARRIAELPQGIRDLGSALHIQNRADALAKDIEQSLAKYGSGVKDRGIYSIKKLLYIVWPEPLIVAGPGTAIDDAISILGWSNIASTASSAYPKYSLEEVIRQAPDIILIGKASGMDMVKVSRGILERIKSLPAVREDNVCYLGDGLYRLGPRVVQGIEELAVCLEQKSPR